jgi:hypothetical protein
MVKFPFEYVSLHVDEMYKREFDENNIEGINKHCEFIAEFIKVCGWDEESYIRAMMGFEPLDSGLN